MLELEREQTRIHVIDFGIAYSGRAQKLIEMACAQAQLRGHGSVGTAHLLFALLELGAEIQAPAQMGECGGIEILDAMQIDRNQLKQNIDRQFQTAEGALDALSQKFDLAIWLRDRKLEIWKKFSNHVAPMS
ncbi:MAG: hypothetical protein KGS72_07635 [Cyanobacteria bacterium REEB67]|nr:hypothetical protein [Cyanobacteria bacterium REEB67]